MNKSIYKKEKKDKRIQVRVSLNELNIFDELCNKTNLSKSELILTLIKREYHKLECIDS